MSYPNPIYGPEHVSSNCQNNPFWISRDLKTFLQHQSIYSIILARFQIYIGCSPGSASGKLCRASRFWKSISCHWQSFIQLMSINPFDDPSIALCLLSLFIRTACLGWPAKSLRSILHLARLTILPMVRLGIICSVMKTIQELCMILNHCVPHCMQRTVRDPWFLQLTAHG